VKDHHKTTEELIGELEELRGRVDELEKSEARLRKREKALRRNRQRFRTFFENAALPHQFLDENGHVLDVNRAWIATLGFTREEVIGRWFGEFLAPRYRERFKANFARFKEGGEGHWAELDMVRKDGSTVAMAIEGKIDRDQLGRFKRTHCVLHDMTELKHTQNALLESEKKYRLLVDRTAEGILVVQDGFLKFVNPRGCDITGYSEAELLSKPFEQLVHPDDRQMARTLYGSDAEGREGVTHFHFRIIVKSESIRWLEHYGMTIPWEGRPACMGLVIDVTDRKGTEDELRESEQRYKSLFELTPEGVIVSVGQTVALANPASAKLLGASEAERITGKSMNEIVHPHSQKRVYDRFTNILTGGTNCEPWEAAFTTLDGRVIDAECVAAPYTLQGAPAVLWVFRDITDRKRAEEALHQSEQRFRVLVESAGDSICLVGTEGDEKGSIVFANSAAAQMHGYTLDELLTRNITDLYLPESSENVSKGLDGILSKARLRGQAVHRRKDGSSFPIERNAAVIEWSGHRYVMVIDRDVSEREEAQEALRASEEKMRLIIDSSPIGIRIARQGRYTYANPAFLRLFGFAHEREILGRPVDEIHFADDRDRLKRALDGESGAASSYDELRCIKKDGTRFDVASWGISIDFQGGPASLAFLVDVSREKALRSQLLHAQKMEAIGTLAGGIAHDFNNILQVVLGYSDFLLTESACDLRCKDDLRKINLAARNGADLVQRLLTFSRKTEVRPRPLNLNRQIEQARSLLFHTLPKMIEIDLILSGDPAVVNADPTLIEQVLMNLAVNARDAMPEGGRLVMRTQRATLDEDYCKTHLGARPGLYMLLSVSDTGHGMDKKTLEHIFEPFYTTKGPGQGTGLGLATVYGIVKQHDGYITCSSEPGKGTTFHLYFPAMGSELRREESFLRPMPRSGTETILLVDDEALLRELGARILAKAGYTVLTAADGKKALESYQLHRETVSLVILDLIMPEMGGKQCLAELLKMNPDVKVLIASGYVGDGPPIEVEGLGAKGFLSKPYDMWQMLQSVREALDNP